MRNFARKWVREWLGIPDVVPSFLSYPQSIEVVMEQRNPCARLPIYATDGSACADFFPVLTNGVDRELDEPRSFLLEPGEMMAVRLGWAVQVPKHWCLELHSRSGQGKVRVSLANRTGIIDSDFTGELVALVVNEGDKAFAIRECIAICQAKLSPAPQMNMRIGEMKSTARGFGGFGHTDHRHVTRAVTKYVTQKT